MTLFRVTLAVLLIALLAYTANTIAHHGWDFIRPFFGAIGRRDWQGQFNADFLIMLMLSAAWTAWRNGGTAQAWLLGALALTFGAGFLCIYLLVLSVCHNGDMRVVLAGTR